MTDTQVAHPISTHHEQADLTLNGVEIYDATLSAASNTFKGKLGLISSFSDETGVIASACKEILQHGQLETDQGRYLRHQRDNVYLCDGGLDGYLINAKTGVTGITAELDGANVILKGDGVENVDIAQKDYSVTTSGTGSIDQGATRRSADTGTQTQRIAFGSADLAVGRVLTLTFDPTSATNPAGTSADASALLSLDGRYGALKFGHTVASGESAGDVATAFYNLILNRVDTIDESRRSRPTR